MRRFLGYADEHTGADYVAAMRRRDELTRDVEALFDDIDILMMPTLPVPAPRRDTETLVLAGREHEFTLAMVRYTCLFDHTGHPVVAMPVGVLEPGVAVSAQVVAPLRRDDLAVGYAQCLEEAMGLRIDHGVLA